MQEKKETRCEYYVFYACMVWKLAIYELDFSLSRMRYMAWIAIFSLQLGMFVCEAGVDVCHADETSSQIQLSPSQSDNDHATNSIDTCAAHAAHVFLGHTTFNYDESVHVIKSVGLLTSLNIPEFFLLIDQPPKPLHS